MYPNPKLNNMLPVDTHFNANGYHRFFDDNLTIVNKDKLEVPFTLQPAQDSLLGFMSQYYLILILKARKMGFSSLALAIAVAKFILGENEKCVTMSFDQSAADKQLARAKHFIKAYELANGVKIPFKFNSKSEMAWEGRNKDGRPFINTLRVGTAQSTSFGRGDDITFLHLTEVSLVKDIETLLAGVGEAVVNGAHTILETTANGYNSYKSFWDDSMLDLKGFLNLFYSPEWEYDQQFLAAKAQKLGRLMSQEYPMTPEEAFISSGDTYIENLSLKDLLDQVKAYEATRARLQLV